MWNGLVFPGLLELLKVWRKFRILRSIGLYCALRQPFVEKTHRGPGDERGLWYQDAGFHKPINAFADLVKFLAPSIENQLNHASEIT